MSIDLALFAFLKIAKKPPPPPSVDPELVDRFFNNEHVWQRIFYYLDLRDRMHLERVDKRLQKLMLKCWPSQLTFDCGEADIFGPTASKRSEAVLAICSRIGSSLRSLALCDDLEMAWPRAFQLIADACPNIDYLMFVVTKTIGDEENYTDRYVIGTDVCFDAFTKLRCLQFFASDIDFAQASAAVFMSIPPTVEILTGLSGGLDLTDDFDQSLFFETPRQLERFFAEHPALKEVVLKSLWVRKKSRRAEARKAKIFPVIAANCPQLKKLTLHSFCDIDLEGIEALEGMLELDIEVSACLTDAQAVTMCERNPDLEVLLMPYDQCEKLTRAGFAGFATLKKLKQLAFKGKRKLRMPQMTSFVRELVANSGATLLALDVCGEWRFATAAVEAMAGCPQLRSLKFSVRATETTVASIRYLVGSVVGDRRRDLAADTLYVLVRIECNDDEEYARFEELVAPEANLPAGVDLHIMKL